jgi:omega-6 fatty acid desaturase (delta-12 desaturase)
MGKGGYSVGARPSALARQPVEKPPFTIGTLRKAIPAHCFERSLLKSLTYLLVDLAAATALFLGITHTDACPLWARLILWPAYWFFQVITRLECFRDKLCT